MAIGETNQELLEAWREGDQRAASILFHRYQVRLLALIRSRLSRKLARRIDPEDVLLSAYRSFFVAAKNGQVVAAGDDNIWTLLTTFVLRKLAHQARRHTSGQRSVDREQLNDSIWIEEAISNEPSAEQGIELIEQVERIINQLDQTARDVLVSTLQGHDAKAIAQDLGINERSVRRALERIREKLPRLETNNGSRSKLDSECFARSINQRPSISGTTTYDRYLLQKLVGIGAFSKVYRATERETGETVAIKFLKKECWYDSRACDSMMREYELLRKLDAPRILNVRGWGTTPGGALFLVTDFINGMNLAKWKETVEPNVHTTLTLFWQITFAVVVAHSSGIVHGDLKPANVLIREDGRAILCDFGFARFATAPEDVPRGGTAGFLAPEQITAAFGPVTFQTDVYGLGATLYAMLTGRPPMSGRDLPEILANVLSASRPDAPSKTDPSAAIVDNIVLRCLEKEPAQRYATVLELHQALLDAMTDDVLS